MKLQEEEEESKMIASNFKSLQEELDFKTDKLTKMWD